MSSLHSIRRPVWRAHSLLVGFFLWGLLASPGAAEGKVLPLPLSFREALLLAKEQHIEVIVANERIEQAITRISQARSALLPQIEGSAYEFRQTINLKSLGIDIPLPGFNNHVGPFSSFDARISLTQAILDPAAIERLRAAKAARILSAAERNKTEQDVMALVGTLYVEAARAQDAVELYRALLKRSEERLRVARDRRRIGLGTELEVSTLTAESAETKSRFIQAQTEAHERRLDLTAALNLPNDEPLIFTQESGRVDPNLPDQELKAAVSSHPDVEITRKLIAQRKAEKKTAQAEYFPKIVGLADYGASGASPVDTDDTYKYGAQLTLPIFQGGYQQARVREAESKLRESKARLKDVEHQTEAKILSARESLIKTIALLRASDADLAAAKKQFSIARDRLQTGLGTELELVEAAAQVAVMKDKKNEAQALYQLARLNLAHAMGQMEGLI